MSQLEMNDISIDLETLGMRFDAPILSIACRVFDRDTGTMGKAFYQEITLDSSMRTGVVNGGTLEWWMGQSDKARQLFKSKPEKLDLASALMAMCTFIRSVGTGAPRVWGNGATADITWLEHAIAKGAVGIGVPWGHTNIRDMRTIVDAADYDYNDVPFVGTKHWAPDDALHQAKVISHCWRKIRGIKGKPAKAPAPQVATVEDDDL